MHMSIQTKDFLQPQMIKRKLIIIKNFELNATKMNSRTHKPREHVQLKDVIKLHKPRNSKNIKIQNFTSFSQSK